MGAITIWTNSFFYYARGSMCETLSHFISAHHAGYIDADQLKWVRETETEATKSLNGYLAFVRKQQQGSTEFGHRLAHDKPAYSASLDVRVDELVADSWSLMGEN
mgnify:CR=1 FL=1